MDHFSKKDMLKITGKWLVIFGTIMIIFCAYQYRLGSMYTSWMISLVGSLEHQTDVETAIFGEFQEEDYQSGLQSIRDAGLEKTGEDNLYQTIISYGRNWYVVMTVMLCLTGMAYDCYRCRKNAVRAEKYAEQIREEERTRLQEEKDHVIKEREKMGAYMENIAHQLKTPTAGMMLGLEYLQDTEADEQRQRRLGQCINQLERMSDMTASLLRLAQIDSGKIWMKKKKENLSELLNESVDAVEPTSCSCVHFHFWEWIQNQDSDKCVRQILRIQVHACAHGAEYHLFSALEDSPYYNDDHGWQRSCVLFHIKCSSLQGLENPEPSGQLRYRSCHAHREFLLCVYSAEG